MSDLIQDTTIYIGDFTIHEPVTVLTDFIITGLCLYFYLQLNQLSGKDVSAKNWKYFYGFMSISSFLGGCSHAFFAVHEGLGYKTFWLGMQVLNVFSIYYMQQGVLYSVLKNSLNKRYWSISYTIQCILASIAVFIFQSFIVIIINTAIGLIPIMIFHFLAAKQNKNNLWIAYGIVVLFATALVNAVKLTIHPYFNHLDLAHVLIMVNISLMFIGVKRNTIALQSA